MIPTRLVVLLVAVPSWTGAAMEVRAAGPSQPSLRAFCSADYARLCNGLDANGPEALACLRKNIGAASPGCRAALSEFDHPSDGRTQAR